MKAAIYCRVSTKKRQDIETQLIPIREYCERNKLDIFNIYLDVGESGSKTSRPNFNNLMKDLRKNKFKAIVVYKLDRIGRSTQHLLQLFTEFEKKGIEFISITQNIDTTTPEGKMFLRIMMIMAEYERELIINRVNSGIARAKAQGKKLGRPKNNIQTYQVLRLRNKGMSLREIAKELNTNLGTIQRRIKTGGA